MARKMIDCRDYPSDFNCTVAIAADTENELVDLAVLHAVEAHGEIDTPELRDEIRKSIKVAALT
jgi:predicted small metal-binding protein